MTLGLVISRPDTYVADGHGLSNFVNTLGLVERPNDRSVNYHAVQL